EVAVSALQIGVPDVPTAYDRDRVVGDEQLVVHPALYAGKVSKRTGEARRGRRSTSDKGVEEPHLHVGILRQSAQQIVGPNGVHVIQEQTNTDATNRGIPQYPKHCSSSAVARPD